MRTYALILHERIADLYSCEGDIEGLFPPNNVWVRIDELNPIPERGWDAHEASGMWAFLAPSSSPGPSLASVKEGLCAAIDATADDARAAVASNGLRLSEYEWALAESQAFKDAGYTGDVPESLAIWVTATGWTPEVACDNILQTAAAWQSFRAAVRRRLIGKANVNAATDAASAQAAADAAIAEINASLAAVQG